MAEAHAKAFCRTEGVQVSAVCSRSTYRAQSFAARFGRAKAWTNVAEMLNEEQFDGVVVAVAHDATVSVSEQVLARSIPCLIEKPAGYTLAETQRLAELARATKSINMVALNRRFMSVIQDAIAAVLSRGPLLGFFVEANEPIDRRRSEKRLPPSVYDHWFIANTIHAVDLIRLVGGELEEIHGFCVARYEAQADGFSYSMRMSNGSLGTFASHWNSPGNFGLRLFGDGITARLSPFEAGTLQFDGRPEARLVPAWWDVELKPGLYLQSVNFLKAVCEHRRVTFPASDLEDNVRTMRLLETLLNPSACLSQGTHWASSKHCRHDAANQHARDENG